jgi:Phage integrase, N-terminal SAM-like domain/Phage integrase family
MSLTQRIPCRCHGHSGEEYDNPTQQARGALLTIEHRSMFARTRQYACLPGAARRCGRHQCMFPHELSCGRRVQATGSVRPAPPGSSTRHRPGGGPRQGRTSGVEGNGTERVRPQGLALTGSRRAIGSDESARRRTLTWPPRRARPGAEEPSARQTVEQYLLYWLETIKRHRIEPSTYVRCRYDIRRHLIPRLGEHLLTKLASQHLQSFYAQELADGFAPGTVRNMHKTLHSALESAVKLGFVHRNVADMAEPPRGGSQEIIVLTEDQSRTLLQTVRGDRLEALIVVALATGIRKGELQDLRWQDIDLNAGIAPSNQDSQNHARGPSLWPS